MKIQELRGEWRLQRMIRLDLVWERHPLYWGHVLLGNKTPWFLFLVSLQEGVGPPPGNSDTKGKAKRRKGFQDKELCSQWLECRWPYGIFRGTKIRLLESRRRPMQTWPWSVILEERSAWLLILGLQPDYRKPLPQQPLMIELHSLLLTAPLLVHLGIGCYRFPSITTKPNQTKQNHSVHSWEYCMSFSK